MDQVSDVPEGDFVACNAGVERRGDARVGIASPAAGAVLGQEGSGGEPWRLEPARLQTTLPLDAVSIDGMETFRIKASDVSRGGMRFYSTRVLRPGDRFAVRFRFVNAVDRLVLCEVRHFSGLVGEWHQGGVEFVDALTASRVETVLPSRWRKQR